MEIPRNEPKNVFPLPTKILFMLASVFGVFPMEWGSILAGRPKFSWFSLGVLFSAANLLLEVDCVLYYVVAGDTLTSNAASKEGMPSQSPIVSTSTTPSPLLTTTSGYATQWNLSPDVFPTAGTSTSSPMSAKANANGAYIVFSVTDGIAIKIFDGVAIVCQTATILLALLKSKRMVELLGQELLLEEDIEDLELRDKNSDGNRLLILKPLAFAVLLSGSIWFTICWPMKELAPITFSVEFLTDGKRNAAMVMTSAIYWNFGVTLLKALRRMKARADLLTTDIANGNLKSTLKIDLSISRLHDDYCHASSLCQEVGDTLGSSLAIECASHVVVVVLQSYYVSVLMQSPQKDSFSITIWVAMCSAVFLRLTSLALMLLVPDKIAAEDDEFRKKVRNLFTKPLKPTEHPEGFLLKTVDYGRIFAIVAPSKYPMETHDSKQNVDGAMELTGNFSFSARSRDLITDLISRETMAMTANGFFSLTKENFTAAINVILTYLIILVQFRQADPSQGK